MSRLRVRAGFACVALSLCLASGASAQTPVFGSPNAPLPAAPGTGLSGSIWSSPAIEPVDDLASARAYLVTHAEDALFTATVVDYPNGTAGSISTETSIGASLGVDGASISNPTVAAAPALNSIFLISGYLRVEAPGVVTLGVGSDDGSELLIQGVPVVNNDGLHSFPGAAPVAVEFGAAGLYAVDILFFESQATEWGLEFYTGSPGAGTPVPTGLLYPTPEPGTGSLAAVCGLVSAWGLRRRVHR